MIEPTTLATLRSFRQKLYTDGLGYRQDSLFDLLDAVLTAPSATSLVRLSLCGAFRRRWPSTGDALSDGTVHVPALRRLVLQHRPEAAAGARPVWVGDGTVWPRPAAAVAGLDRWAAARRPAGRLALVPGEIHGGASVPLSEADARLDHPAAAAPSGGGSLELAVWQLWLARPLVADQRLPWQRPLPAERLAPGRVRRAFSGLLATVGSPARAPHPNHGESRRAVSQGSVPARRAASPSRNAPIRSSPSVTIVVQTQVRI